MTVDLARSIELLASDVMRTFKEGLQLLMDQMAEQAAIENRRLDEKSLRIEQERQMLQQEKDAFAREKALFQEAQDRYGPDSQEHPQMVSLNIAGKTSLAVLRAILTQCKGSLLASQFSGRWDLPKDGEGRIYIEFEPQLFKPLVDHLRTRFMDGEARCTPPPRFSDQQLDAKFQEMLQYYGVREWIYRMEPVEHEVRIRDQTFAVWPTIEPNEKITQYGMAGQTVVLPRGWEVMPVWVQEFDAVMKRLLEKPWGTSRLCARAANGELWSYRTRLAFGTPGTRDDVDHKRVEELDDGLAYRFAEGQSSSRLLIRARVIGGDPVEYFGHTLSEGSAVIGVQSPVEARDGSPPRFGTPPRRDELSTPPKTPTSQAQGAEARALHGLGAARQRRTSA